MIQCTYTIMITCYHILSFITIIWLPMETPLFHHNLFHHQVNHFLTVRYYVNYYIQSITSYGLVKV